MQSINIETENISRKRYYELGYMDYYELADTVTENDFNETDTRKTKNKDSLQEPTPAFNHFWFGLFNMLTYSEANMLYATLKTRVLNKERHFPVKLKSGLYFINEGQLSLIKKHNRSSTDTMVYHSGSLLGGEPFLNDEISVVIMEDSVVDYLETDDLKHLESSAPDLFLKLKKFTAIQSGLRQDLDNCDKESKEASAKKEFKERRKYTRVSAFGIVTGHLDGFNSLRGKFPIQGTLIDISKGGFSFDILPIDSISLVGKRIDAVLNINSKTGTHDIAWRGRIVAVRQWDHRTSVHIEGDRPGS